MKYSFKDMLLATALLCSVSSCIKEDRSECNPGVLLKYDYSLNTEYTNLFGAEVGKVTVYVFDEQGLYYDCYSDEGKHLTNDYQMLLPLPVGNYTTVTWGGALSTYRVGETNTDETAFQGELKKGVTHIDNFMLMAERAGEPLVHLDALYHGKTDVISDYWPRTATTVNLMKDTKHLTVTIEDVTIEEGKSTEPYEVHCEGTNGRFLADNSFGKKAEEIINQSYNTYTEPGKMVTEMDLLRLVLGRKFFVKVKNSAGETVYNRDLVKAMLDTGKFATQEDFDRESEYEMVIKMDKNVVVTVTINGWEVINLQPDL